MRRPSWNKSQAIQQVISLKALLEGHPGCDDCPVAPGIFKKPRPPSSSPSSPPVAGLTPRAGDEAAGSDSYSPALAKEPSPSPYRRRDPIPPLFSVGEPVSRIPAAGTNYQPLENRCLPPRVAAEAPAGRMTIFYDGRLNVYDCVTADQARTIMELAASPGWYDDVPVCPNRPTVPHFRPAFLGAGPTSVAPTVAGSFPTLATGKLLHHHHHHHQITDGVEEWRASRENEPDGPTTRKASLQRYLEKRKDRFKGKKIVGGLASSGMNMMCLSQKLSIQDANEQSSQSDRFSPTMPRPPGTPARCSSMVNRAQKDRIYIDLNDDGGGN